MLSINILPKEIAQEERKRKNKHLVIRVTSVFMVVVASIVAFILGFQIYKNEEQKRVLQDLRKAEAEVASLSQEEGYLSVIGSRLKSMTEVSGIDLTQINNYRYIIPLLPSGIRLTSFSVAKDGSTAFVGVGDDIASLEEFYKLLTVDSKNKGKIGNVTVNSLSKGVGSTYKFDFLAKIK